MKLSWVKVWSNQKWTILQTIYRYWEISSSYCLYTAKNFSSIYPCKKLCTHTYTHTHTYIYIYIYIYVCVCVCVCVTDFFQPKLRDTVDIPLFSVNDVSVLKIFLTQNHGCARYLNGIIIRKFLYRMFELYNCLVWLFLQHINPCELFNAK